ncbi:hypothetical protein FEM48_Zijuj01G0087100 [Ziziphus jujuba var. spinosa]|uniref:Uncharacterized protein n=1 Tax=Ziziphus jujuba var. spinosa TaxID=714518 RepID=A0A978W093_ZIZJJ|nr:hypothetical protein FEM48_Zijuj01G0087100 [Ziziphus jujuba var. spinosa]
MYSSNSESVRDAVCFFLDEEQGHEIAFVQFPQVFDNITENDIYSSSLRLTSKVEPKSKIKPATKKKKNQAEEDGLGLDVCYAELWFSLCWIVNVGFSMFVLDGTSIVTVSRTGSQKGSVKMIKWSKTVSPRSVSLKLVETVEPS